MQLLPNGRILLLSKERLTIHELPTLSAVAPLDALTSSHIDALWSRDLSHPGFSPISHLWAFEDFPTRPLAGIDCVVCILALDFRYAIRVPSSTALPLEVDNAFFAEDTFNIGTDLTFYRGVIDVNSSGIALPGCLDDWVKVDGSVASLQCSSRFEYEITSGARPVPVTKITFDEGSGRVCVTNHNSNDVEILDFI